MLKLKTVKVCSTDTKRNAAAKEQKREPCPATSDNNVQALAENLRFTGIYLFVRCSAQKTDSKKTLDKK